MKSLWIPSFSAAKGKTTACTKRAMTPFMDIMTPTFCTLRPRPPGEEKGLIPIADCAKMETDSPRLSSKNMGRR